MSCGICGCRLHTGAIVTIRDLWGRRHRIPACPFCADFVRGRQRP